VHYHSPTVEDGDDEERDGDVDGDGEVPDDGVMMMVLGHYVDVDVGEEARVDEVAVSAVASGSFLAHARIHVRDPVPYHSVRAYPFLGLSCFPFPYPSLGYLPKPHAFPSSHILDPAFHSNGGSPVFSHLPSIHLAFLQGLSLQDHRLQHA
jgi:hypothetical protein